MEENLNCDIEKDLECQEYIENYDDIKKPNKKMTFFYFILIAIIFTGLFVYMVLVDGIDNIINILYNVDYKWVLGGICSLIVCWICNSLVLHIPLKKLYPNQSYKNSFKIAMLGLLFDNITPFSSGGQPMQAYELTKTGKKVSDSLSAMALKFVVTQTALVIFTLVVVAFEFDFFANLMQNFLWVAIIGFVINVLLIAVVIIAGINKNAITFFTTPIIKFLGKIKIIKHSNIIIDRLNKSIDNFRNQFIMMKNNKLMILKMFILATFQSLAYYSITYMVYRAFGNSGVSFWQIIPTQAFLLLIMTLIPTPGAGIGAEGGFLLLFNSIFKQGTINMSILFWRLYTFYLPIIIGCFFLIPINNNKKQV